MGMPGASRDGYGRLNSLSVSVHPIVDEARQNVDDSFAYITDAPQTSFANTTVYSDFAKLLLLMWEQAPEAMPDAEQKATALLKRYKRYVRIFPFAQPTYWRLRGWHEWLNGRESQALKSWSKALAEAASKDMPYEAGMTHYEIGRHLPVSDPRREQHLGQAVGILTELEATFDAAQAEAALRDVT